MSRVNKPAKVRESARLSSFKELLKSCGIYTGERERQQ